MNKQKKYFFNIKDLLEKYPDALYYIVTGGRSTGKTYSTLNYMRVNHKKFIFLKRTNEDIKLLCGTTKLNTKNKDKTLDMSPFKSINRDFNCNIKAFNIDTKNGIGAFYECDDAGEPIGDLIGYAMSLSSIYKFKGFDLSEVEYIIFDEFIPNKWEFTRKNEGVQIAELYKTVARAREHFDNEPLKVIMLANSTQIVNSIFLDLNLVDIVAEMQINDEMEKYLEDRHIIICRYINDEFSKIEEKSKIYDVMSGTKWRDMALNNNFSNDDFSQIKKINIKNYRCLFDFLFEGKKYYCYFNDNYNHYYFCNSRNNRVEDHYNLNKEIDQERLYYDWILDIKNECVEGNCSFQSFLLYELIMRYTKYFNT